MGTPQQIALVEDLASLVLSVDADEAGFAALASTLRELEQVLPAGSSRELITRAIGSVADLKGIAPREALKAVSDACSALQKIVTSEDEPAQVVGAPARSVARDAETLELVRDFLQESGDGLSVADEILLNIEVTGATSEKVNALFRVFHSIKGVAGFLELTEIVALAHNTESLMNEVRDQRCALEGDALELVFKSTGVLRQMLEQLKQACEAGVEIPVHPECKPLVARLVDFLAKIPQDGAEAVASAPVVLAPAPAPLPPPVDAGFASLPNAPAPSAPVSLTPVPAPMPSAPSGFESRPSAIAPHPTAPMPEPRTSAPEGDGLPAPSPSVPGAPKVARMRETVKVDLERVDGMVEMIGELIIVESMLKHSRDTSSMSVSMRNTLSQLGKISRDLQNAAMRMRTVPVHNTFQKMARLTREVSKKAGKDIVLAMQGEGTEMDRAMVERLEDPLVHMVRNAIDHGVEGPEGRAAAGKPSQSVLTLSAYHQGGSIVIELADDGRGLDRDRILKKAMEKGLVDDPSHLSEQDIYQLIFAPGFSTAAKVTDISGRGVGMDVVKRNVEGMRGRVFIETTPGKGTTFRLVLPLTLAIIDGMLISVGKERYLIPSLSIIESLKPTASMLTVMGQRDELLTVRGQVLPMLRLSNILDVPNARQEPSEALVVVLESLGKRVGLLVDTVIAQQQVVIKALGQGVGKAEYYSGAAILSDGNVGLILNVDKLCGLISYKPRAASSGAPQLEARP